MATEKSERYRKALTAMNIAGLESLGHEVQLDGSIRNIDTDDLLGLSQNGARISIRWARLVGIPREEFMRLIGEAWEQQTAEDQRDNVRAVKAVLS